MFHPLSRLFRGASPPGIFKISEDEKCKYVGRATQHGSVDPLKSALVDPVPTHVVLHVGGDPHPRVFYQKHVSGKVDLIDFHV